MSTASASSEGSGYVTVYLQVLCVNCRSQRGHFHIDTVANEYLISIIFITKHNEPQTISDTYPVFSIYLTVPLNSTL